MGRFVQVCLNDTWVISKAAAEHAEQLKLVLQLLQEHSPYAERTQF